METTNAYKGGRCFNGAHRDAGKIIHIIPGKPANGFWSTKSLCGAEPGRRGFGWADTKKEATCKACKKKLGYLMANEVLNKERFVIKDAAEFPVFMPHC